ncbi:MAG: Y-family DNA polymerase [Candidatus Omnitrophica bacterium]|nr:Y-family DNA polymerase [Candidatus Omnitrophota bacterium]MDE2221794.1 Y-family DNA polymerase [Candidatus Omnitrophota bacterium]
MTKLFALCDCNNFFASCERVFDPSLRGKPVVVLSNNDGCVIARSNEAKALGIGMAEPYFKCRDLIEHNGVKVYSANFVLYGDLSARVMSTLAQFTPEIEIYSIDEAFLSLDGLSHDPLAYVKGIREQVRRDTGMPVSIGVAPTKTLAKAANRIAKKYSSQGVYCLSQQQEISHWLEKIEVRDIWGIGTEKAEFLKRHGIVNASQLAACTDEWIKKHLTITTLKTVLELRGISCLPLEDVLPDKKSIGTSRTFGWQVSALEELEEAAAAYIGNAAEKLREQKSVCGYVQVFIETDRFKEGRYANAAGIDMTPPTAYTPDLIAAAKRLVKKIYREGYRYKKAGVILTDLRPDSHEQVFLFDETYKGTRKSRIMEVMDGFNRSTNSGKIFVAGEGVKQPWDMKQAHKSMRFTTRWDELLEIRI